MVDQTPNTQPSSTPNATPTNDAPLNSSPTPKAAQPAVSTSPTGESLNKIAPAAGPAPASADALKNAITIQKPAAGETKTYDIVSGKDYNFAFDVTAARMTIQGSDVVIRFKDGSIIVLDEFNEKIGFDNHLYSNGSEIAIPDFVQMAGFSLGKEGPAAGGNQPDGPGGDNSGAAFSQFDAGGLAGARGPLSPLDPTALNYPGVPGPHGDLVFLNRTPDGRPGLPNLIAPDRIVDETTGEGAVGDFSSPLMTAGQVTLDYGPDGPGGLVITGTSSPTLTHRGDPVGISISADGHTATGTTPGGDTVFVYTIDPVTGNYTYTQYLAFDHPDATNPNDPLDLQFDLKITDADGDFDTGSVVIRVLDDGPAVLPSDGGNDETGGFTLGSSGTVAFDYGSDGAGSLKLIGAPASGSLTSHGQPISISVTDGVVTGTVGSTTIFTLTLNTTTGAWSYQQFGPLDHPDATDPNDVLDLGFKVRVTDYDGDSVDAPITVRVRDDGPSIQDTDPPVDETGGFDSISGHINFAYGEDGAGDIVLTTLPTGLTSHDQAVTVTLSPDGHTATGTVAGGGAVFTLVLDPATGDYTFTQLAALDHPDATDPNDVLDLGFGLKVTDGDDDSVTGHLTVQVYDDGPTGGSVSLTDPDLGGSTVNGTLPHTFGQDGSGHVHLVSGPSGLTSNGVAVQITVLNGSVVGTANGAEVFSFTINTATGEYVYQQSLVLDGNPTFNLGYLVTDFDQDTAPGTITITAKSKPDGKPCIDDSCVKVDETNAGGDCDGVWAAGKALSVAGKVDFSYGPDGAGELTLNQGPSGLTHHGQSVNVLVAGNVATGKLADGTTVFTLTLNASDGSYVYKQYASLDHPDASNPDDQIGMTFKVSVTDSDGDTATGNITVKVNDDGPKAGDICFEVCPKDDCNPCTPLATSTGNSGLSYGADGAGKILLTGSTTVYSNGSKVNIAMVGDVITGKTIAGQTVFTLQLGCDGKYVYTQYAEIDGTKGTKLSFDYKVIDADGDTATGKIAVSVEGMVKDCPCDKDDVPTITGSEVKVDETKAGGDCDGVWASGKAISASGKITYSYGDDGAGTLSLQSGPTGLTHHGAAIAVALAGNVATGKLADGTTVFTLTLNTNDGSYTYKQFASIDHPNASNPDDQISMNFGVKIADKDGDTATGAITVKVNDDGPCAGDVCIKVKPVEDCDANTPLVTATGSTGISYGADGEGHLALTGTMPKIYSDGKLVTIALSGDVITGTANGKTVFTLELGCDGKYTYKQLGDIDGKNTTMSFDYKVVDADGDKAVGKIAVSVEGIVQQTCKPCPPTNCWDDRDDCVPSVRDCDGKTVQTGNDCFVKKGCGDVLDLSKVLAGHHGDMADLSKFVKLSDDGAGNTLVKLDSSGSGSNFEAVAKLQGVVGVTLDHLVADGSVDTGRFLHS